ncbi:MAG: autotransporter assembly complex protein TamA [Pseudohongiellaceae bacterium]
MAVAADEPLIQIQGVEGELRANLLAHLKLETASCDATLPQLRRQLPDIRRQITAGLNALGYYHATLGARFGREPEVACWNLLVEVVPGEPVLLREVEIRVAAVAQVQELFQPVLDEARPRPGRVLHHGEYEDLKSAFSSKAADLGFLDARFDAARIALDLSTRAADLQLVFVPGERYRFGEFRTTRPGLLSPALIASLLPVRSGEPYGAEKLVELRNSLDRSQYFQQIRVTPRLRDAQDGAVPVDLDLRLRPRHAWTGGLGFTTDTGPRARLAYENRYLNSRGHRLAANSSVSTILSQINGSYIVPVQHPLADQLVYSAGYIVESNEAFDSQRIQLGLSLPSQNRFGWQQTLGVELQRDDYELAASEDVSVLVLPGITLSKTRADDLINPRRGWKLQGSLKGSSQSLLSKTTFLQFHGNARLVRSFGAFRLLTRAELGATWIDDTLELPASLRFFAGGDQSIRGYDFRAIAPLDLARSTLEGGKQLAVASMEVDFPVRDRWRVAMFTDAGNAFNRFDTFDVQQSVGIGLRWLSPIGPVRVDLAHALDADQSFRIHVTMGPDL